MYFYVFRLLSESAGPVVKKKKSVTMFGLEDFIPSHRVCERPMNMMRYHCCDYGTLYGKRDFADINSISNQLA